MLLKLRPKRSETGFTLLELLIVVIVIGVLAAIALPVFLNQQRAAIDASVKSDVRNTTAEVVGWQTQHAGHLPSASEAYIADGGKLTESKGAYVNVGFTSATTYTVCGYNPGGANYADYKHAWQFDSATGKFTAGTNCYNAVHQRGSSTDTGGDSAGTGGTVISVPVSGGDGSGGTGSSGGTGGTSTATPIVYDPVGATTIHPGICATNPAVCITPSPTPTPTPDPTPTPGPGPAPKPDPNPTTDPTDPTTDPTTPTTDPTTPTTPITATPGGTTLEPYAVGPGNPSCSYAVAPSPTSTFIDANCHKVHVDHIRRFDAFGVTGYTYIYEFDHDENCPADPAGAYTDARKNADSQGRPCDWLQIGGHNQATSVNATYGTYYFDFGAAPSWNGSNAGPDFYPCAMPVYHTNYQLYAFNVCMTDHGWSPTGG